MDLQALQTSLDADADLREQIKLHVKGIEVDVRSALSALNSIHVSSAVLLPDNTAAYKDIRVKLAALAAMIPDNQNYRFSDLWSRVLQQISFMCALDTYLKEKRIATPQDLVAFTDVPFNQPSAGLHFTIEEFLHGSVSLSNELSRLAVTSVIGGHFDRPREISQFLSDLHSSFQLLNLKNDSLRKRFDGMKYDLKKVEEVVFNLQLRGLSSATPTTA